MDCIEPPQVYISIHFLMVYFKQPDNNFSFTSFKVTKFHAPFYIVDLFLAVQISFKEREREKENYKPM
jgi:hypothetical protein